MRTIEVDKVIVRATAGSNVYDCIRDAIIMAMKENRNIELKHNDNTYDVNPSFLEGIIYRSCNND